MEKHNQKSEIAALRQKAEELMKNKPSTHDSQLSEVECRRLIYELQVHQIELELQNEELIHAQAAKEAANDKYVRLYDLAPSGYFSLSRDGKIIGLNLTGAFMLGKDRSHLTGSKFALFVSPDTRLVFKLFLEKAFKDNVKEFCEVNLTTSGNHPVYVHLSGVVTDNGTHCLITAVNVTERQLVEDKLKESEFQYRNLANSGSALIWTSGTDKLCNYFNEPWFKFTGRTLNQEIGNGWRAGLHPRDLDRFDEIYESAFDKRVPFEMEFRLRNFCGEYRWILDLGAPNFNGKGEFVGFIGHCFDISERKQTEIALSVSEKKYRNIFESVQDVYFEASMDGTVLEISPSIEVFSKGQFRRNEMIGQSFAEIYANPGDRNVYFSKLFEQKRVNDYELSLRNKDGSIIPAAISSALSYDANGKPIKITGILRNITERHNAEKSLKASEEKYHTDLLFQKAILESPISIVIFSIDKNYCYSNFSLSHFETMKKIWGVEIKVGMNMVDLIPNPEDRDKAKHNFDRVFEGDSFIVEEEYGDKKLSRNYYDDYYSPVKNTEGTIVGASVFVLDVSKRRQAELKVIELNADLEKKVSQKTQQFKEALSRLEKIADRVPGVVYQFQLNPDGSSYFPYASSGIQDIYRVSPEDVVHDASAVFARLHPDDFDGVVASIQASAKNNTLWQHEYRVKFEDGMVLWLSGNAMPQTEEDGTIRWHGYISDITERKLAEQALREIELKHSSMISNISDVIGIMGADGIMKYKSPNIEKYFGWKPHDLIGTDGWLTIHPDDLDRIQKDFLDLLQNNKSAKTVKYRYKCKNGTYTLIELTANNLLNDPVINGVLLNYHDITEREEVENSLRKSEAEKAAIIRAVPDLMFRIRRDGLLMDAYSRDDSMFYSPREVFTGKKVFEVLPPDLARQAMIAIENAFHTREVELFEYERDVQGKKCYFEDRIIPISEDEVLSIIRDITNRKESETALKMQSAAFESFALAIIITDIKGRIQWVNSAFTKLTGYSSIEAIGQMPGDLVKSGKQDKEFYKTFWDTILSKKVWSGEIINRRKDGTLYYEEETITPVLDDEGNLYSFIAIKIDITDRKKLFKELASEKRRLADIIKGTNAGTWEWNIPTGETQLNEIWAELIGYTLEELSPVSIETWTKFAHPDDLIVSAELLEKHFSGELPYYSCESRMRHKNGEWIWVLDRGKVHEWDSDGKPLQMSGTLLEITEQKRIEKALENAKTEAEKANQAKSEFLSRMSHELRTPMNSILGFTQLMEMGELKASHKKGVNHILNSGRHLLNLINEILDISGIEAGRVSLSLIPVELHKIIGETIDTVHPLTHSLHIKLELKNADADRLFVKADPHRLRQVLINLVSNAVKYNREGGSVIIKTELQQAIDPANAFVRISVSDTGPGINPELLEKLFMPFERIGAEKTGIEGTGLGLMVAKKLMDAMGGRVGVESVPGEGSTFWIELPQSEDQGSVDSHTEYRSAAQTMLSENIRTILYIEDNASNTELVEQILLDQRPSIHLVSSTKGAQAVPLSIEYAPDLILLDLDLPDMNGFEVINLLLAEEKTKEIPVVVVSADAMAHQIERLMKAGAKDYLTKPLDIRAFLQVVDEYIGSVK